MLVTCNLTSAPGHSQHFKMETGDVYLQQHYPQYQVPTTPIGLEAIYKACRRIYADQPNPLQVTALVKYWWVYLIYLKQFHVLFLAQESSSSLT